MLSENFTYGHSLTYLCSTDGFRLHYIHTDNLGSWDIITDMGGDLEQSLSFDAWGNRRNASTWNGPAHDVPLFDRGFTGHEHLYNFGLINMNGRVYDPYMSTFLSPDNYIQAPDNSQNFNRYAYCLNNPLKYTDPDGEFWHIIIGAAIGGMVNLTTNWGKIDTFGEGLAYFGIGAAAGALSAGVGAGVSSLIGGGAFGAGFLGTTAAKTAVTSFASGSVIGASSGLAGGFVTGAGNSWMQGANFCQGLLTGAKAGGQGAVMGGLIGGISGGIDAARDGRHFITGKKPYYEAKLEGYQVIKQHAYDDMKCKDAILESIEKLNGGTRTQDDFHEMGQKLIKANNYLTIDDYYRKCGFDVETITRNNEEFTYQFIGEHLSNGNPVVYTTKTGDNLNHAMSIVKIRQWTETSAVKVWVGDPSPLFPSIRKISWDLIRRSGNILNDFYIFKLNH